MADMKVSALAEAAALAAADAFPVVQGGVSKRASAAQIAAFAGGATTAGTLVKFASGRYRPVASAISISTGGAVPGVSGALYGTPFDMDRAFAIATIGIEVTTAGAGSTVALGIYKLVDGVPTTLVLDAGTVESATTGYKEIAVSFTLPPGQYVAALGTSGGTAPNIRAQSGDSASRTDISAISGFVVGAFLGATSVYSGGALPSAFGPLGNGPGGSPRIILKGA